jgi:peptidoglycan-associated lipoprotein
MAFLAVCSMAFVLAGCPDKKPKYPVCSKDDECKEGEKCINKKCVQCGDDSDCEDGKSCVNGACVVKEGGCTSDDDCDGVCVANKCVACENDRQCGPDKRCSNGACLDRGACNIDDDCADDEDCVDGKCQRLGRDKPPDVACKLQTVYFGFDQVGIIEEAASTLQANYDCIKQVSANRGIILYGHTDPRGTEEYNVALSEKRANSVADYLARLGVDPVRFRVIPKGEAEATGGDEGSWKLDRKVELEWQ